MRVAILSDEFVEGKEGWNKGKRGRVLLIRDESNWRKQLGKDLKKLDQILLYVSNDPEDNVGEVIEFLRAKKFPLARVLFVTCPHYFEEKRLELVTHGIGDALIRRADCGAQYLHQQYRSILESGTLL